MSAVAILTAVEAANGLLSLAVNSLVAMQKINTVLAKAQAENRDITEEEWASVVSDADAADKRLADAIKAAGG